MMLQSGLVFIFMVSIPFLLTVLMFMGILYRPLRGVLPDFVFPKFKKLTAKENGQKR